MESFMSWLVFLLSVNSGFSAKIAGISSFSDGSHYFVIKLAIEELASRGHEVAMVVSSDIQLKSSEKLPHKIYKVPFKTGFKQELLVKPGMKRGSFKIPLTIMDIKRVQRVMCECLLNDTKLLQELKSFDLIVYDGTALCGVLVGDLLNIPRVVIEPASPAAPFAAFHMIPTPVSYIPQRITGFSDKMTLLQRVINLGVSVTSKLFLDFALAWSMNALKVKYNIQPEKSYIEAVGDVELVIILADFALEYPQPLLPGNIMVGPLNVRPAKPLPPDLEEFVSSSGGHGFIIVSFGSYAVTVFSKEKVDMLATAFGKLQQKVLWKLKGYIPSFLSLNIKIVDWLPQNDLLGHKDVRAFVSHVGHNSLYESAYHGVPLVAVPLFGDQFSNSKRAVHFVLGLSVDHQTVNAQQLVETIQQVISEPRFKDTASRISRLLKDRRRSSLEETGDWIEHVIRHGGAKHLRAQVFNIPWYQYYLLDVMALLVAMAILVVMVIRLTCRCVCRLCCLRSGSKAKEE